MIATLQAVIRGRVDLESVIHVATMDPLISDTRSILESTMDKTNLFMIRVILMESRAFGALPKPDSPGSEV